MEKLGWKPTAAARGGYEVLGRTRRWDEKRRWQMRLKSKKEAVSLETLCSVCVCLLMGPEGFLLHVVLGCDGVVITARLTEEEKIKWKG